jgi:hypothetical protein
MARAKRTRSAARRPAHKPAGVEATGHELPPEADADAQPGTNDAEQARRRYAVLQLRYHRRLSNRDIAERLGCTERTIDRDRAWWREQWHRVYGTENPIFDPVEKIGETVALYEQVEERALQELQALDADAMGPAIAALEAATSDSKATDAQRQQALALMDQAVAERGRARRASYQRMRCLKTAQEARQQQVNFLQDLGLLDRNLGTLDLTAVQNPEAFAKILEKWRHIPDADVTSAAERAQRKGRIH